VAREAGVDKVLIYRYFGGVDELLGAFGQSGDFWPSVAQVIGDDPSGPPQLYPSENDGRRASAATHRSFAVDPSQRRSSHGSRSNRTSSPAFSSGHVRNGSTS
jgi:hypothetical protein